MNVFLCNDIAQILSEICSISRKQIFNIKKPAPALNREENPSTLTTLTKDLCLVWFWVVFCRPDDHHNFQY